MTNSESHEHDSSSMDEAQIQAAIDRILAADEAQGPQVQHFASDDESIFSGQATALNRFSSGYSTYDGEQDDLAERRALRRVAGLSTELEDVTEVEYRQLRLERVVLAGVWTDGSVTEAENSLRELAALAETAGSEVLDGVVQRRSKPDPSTY
ncbi:MAG: GTPase HflX, partial [Glutamicibacter protophormiae]